LKEQSFLKSGAAVVWLEAGKYAGKEFAKALLSKGIKTEELPHVLDVFFTQGGWGKIQTKVDFTKRQALVTIRNSATARQTKSKEPVCHFIQGFISGVSDVLLDGLTECLETKCLAKGDALCEFRVKRT
jgi:predicted hydrocarbon binding protein